MLTTPPPEPLVLALPFRGPWLVQNSPARRVPSHGSELFGERYAIDFVGVDAAGRTATRNDWRTVAATEPPDRFIAFGQPVLAPAQGRVVVTHDGEPDHESRRSPLTLLGYAVTQARRVGQGIAAVAGNHVILEVAAGPGLPSGRPVFVALVHLQRGSIQVRPGDSVLVGQAVAVFGNSGNSTQPHVHLQAMDSADVSVAQGVPIVFRRFRERARRSTAYVERTDAVPGEGCIVEPLGS